MREVGQERVTRGKRVDLQKLNKLPLRHGIMVAAQCGSVTSRGMQHCHCPSLLDGPQVGNKGVVGQCLHQGQQQVQWDHSLLVWAVALTAGPPPS